MQHRFALALAGVMAGFGALEPLAALAADAPPTPRESSMSNPLLRPSSLDLEYPLFNLIKDAHFAPAFEAGMKEQLAQIQQIADNPEAPSFSNTIEALERSGQLLKRSQNLLDNLTGSDTNAARDTLEETFAPRFAAHRDAIFLNPKLFARIDSLHRQTDQLPLDAEQKYLVQKYFEDFVHAGAQLGAPEKQRLKEINGQLASLSTRFDQNVLAEVNDSAVLVDSPAELDGLSEQQIAAAADAAKDHGHSGKYLISLLNTTGQPVLSQLTNRGLRERIFESSVARGARGNRWDNRDTIAQALKLRAEKAQLLGYPSYAAYSLAEETAKTPEAVNAMLAKLAAPSVAKARKEAAELQALIDARQKAAGQPTFELQPWDWAFYAEKLRKAKYDFDESQIKPYLELNRVLEDGVFYAAQQLYGIHFKERTDLPRYHPDIRTFDVMDQDGGQLAIFIFDPYARPSKRGGAWMSEYVTQSRLLAQKPIVANNINIPKPPAGQPTLLTWDEVTTLFHEFGHALHGLFSNVNYPYFAGTSVPRDFVEYPSQLNEMWAAWPSVLAHYAKHYQTGEAMPAALLDKLKAAESFDQGFALSEYLAAAIVDQHWHQLKNGQTPSAKQVGSGEAAALDAYRINYPLVPPRYHTPYFSHIFGGYAAGYYAYIWSEVLAADTSQWIKTHGGLTRANGDRLRQGILSRGGSQDVLELFKNFYGSDPDPRPLLRKRGLPAD